MSRMRHGLIITTCLLAVSQVSAQENPGNIAPLPFASPQQRITPEQPSAGEQNILTTKKTSALPWQQNGPSTPNVGAPAGFAPAPGAQPLPVQGRPSLPATIPFGRGSGSDAPIVPLGPHAATAVPVENIDHIDSSDTPAAPPTPIAPGADPVNDNPEEPTELTAPLFTAPDTGAARTIVIRALNKVTAQAMTLEGRPGDSLKFGQLVMTPLTCRVSDPKSQLDYAGLIDIKENVPGKPALVPLFRGWMYASSPSINALEHPVYDITIRECKIAGLPKEDAEKPSKKLDKKAGKK
ncbi:MAG: DUF2155 domain-containing protein [Rickettsiales bacterium]